MKDDAAYYKQKAEALSGIFAPLQVQISFHRSSDAPCHYCRNMSVYYQHETLSIHPYNTHTLLLTNACTYLTLIFSLISFFFQVHAHRARTLNEFSGELRTGEENRDRVLLKMTDAARKKAEWERKKRRLMAMTDDAEAAALILDEEFYHR